MGQPLSKTPSEVLLARTKEHTAKGDIGGAYKILSTEGNDAHPEVVLHSLRCLTLLKAPEARESLLRAQANFPRDVRFLLLEASHAQSGEGSQVWEKVLHFLRSLPSSSRSGLSKLVTISLSESFARSAVSDDIVEQIIALYPHAGTLRLQLAERYRTAGQDEKALRHFEFLYSHYDFLSADAKFVEHANLGYIAAWRESLTARRTVS